MTLVIVLKDGRRDVRITDVSRAAGTEESIVALDAQDRALARFKCEDVQRWSVE